MGGVLLCRARALGLHGDLGSIELEALLLRVRVIGLGVGLGLGSG